MNAGRRTFARIRALLFPRSLRYQLLSRLLLILAGLLLVIGLFQYVFMERFLYQNRATSIQRQIQSVPGEAWDRIPEIRRGPADAMIFFPQSSVAYRNKDGRFTVLSTDRLGNEASVPRLDDAVYAQAANRPRRDKPMFRIVQTAEGSQLVVLQQIRTFRGTGGIVQVSTGTRPLKAELNRQFLLYLGLAFAALVGALLSFLPSIRRSLAPLSEMVSTVERIDSGKLNERLPEPRGPAEIDRLSLSFNRMLERLETSFRAEQESQERMRRFVSDASHELRTPLTSIHGFLEVLLRGAAADPAQLDKALRSMHGESARINKLVSDLLTLAKADRAPDLLLVPVDPAVLVRGMEPQLRLLAGDRRIELDLADGRTLPLDADKIKQIVLNLFQNAVQHTDAETGNVRVTVRPVAGGAEIEIADNGPGIAEEHLSRLFERFYRVDASRARKYGGAGLGLSITRSLAELHGGSIKAESRPGEGSRFVVFLPAAAVADGAFPTTGAENEPTSSDR